MGINSVGWTVNSLWFVLSVSSGSIAVHPDSSVQLLAEEATLIDNLDMKVNKILFIETIWFLFVLFRHGKILSSMLNERWKKSWSSDCVEAVMKASSGSFQ